MGQDNGRVVGLLAVLAGAAYLATTYAQNAIAIDASTGMPEIDQGLAPTLGDASDTTPDSKISFTGLQTLGFVDNSSLSNGGNAMTAQEQYLAAFLETIARCEHSQSVVDAGQDYTEFYGGAQFTDLSDHPVLTGELKGVQLPAAMCIAAGYADGVCVSTAAGRGQITVPTWKSIRQAGATSPSDAYLGDFSAASQDEAMRRLLARCGALPYVYAGDLGNAVLHAAGTWASLPGSTAQQNPKGMDYVTAIYNAALADVQSA